MDQTNISVANRQGQWREAMGQIYAMLADSVAAPPSQAEIDREVAVIVDGLDARVAGESTARSPGVATELVRAIDGGSVVTPAQAQRAMFEAQRPTLTPETVGAAMRLLTQGDARVMMTAPVMPAGGEAAFTGALAAARATKAEARIEAKAVSFADLGKPLAPGGVEARTTIPDLGITRVRFANGVELIVKPTDFEKDRVLATVAVGYGVAGLPVTEPSPTWTAGAVMQGGAGPFDIDAMERLTAGRRIAIAFGPDERSFDYSGATNARDLPDTLRLMSAAIAEPRLDADAFARLKSQLAGSYESIFAAPGSVFGVMSGQPLHGGDVRWSFPPRNAITGLKLETWRGFWQPILAAGPRRLVIVGDVDIDAAIGAAAASIGAAVTHPAPEPDAAQLDVKPIPAGSPPIVFPHRGDPGQALLAAVWPTQGVLADVRGARALSVAAVIFQTRLFDRFREAEGGTYSPSVAAVQSQTFPHYGLFIVNSQLRVERREDFIRAVNEIAADLATKGPTPDEVARATAPIASNNERAARTNGYWAAMLERDLNDARVLDQIRTNVTGYQAVKAGDIRKAARKWLKGRVPSTILVASSSSPPALP
jgi:zinc protease